MERFIISVSPWCEGTIFHINDNLDVVNKQDFHFLECMIPVLKEMTEGLKDKEIEILIYNPFPNCDFSEHIGNSIMENTIFQYKIIDPTYRFETGKEE